MNWQFSVKCCNVPHNLLVHPFNIFFHFHAYFHVLFIQVSIINEKTVCVGFCLCKNIILPGKTTES